jgi:hypothetical protein
MLLLREMIGQLQMDKKMAMVNLVLKAAPPPMATAQEWFGICHLRLLLGL